MLKVTLRFGERVRIKTPAGEVIWVELTEWASGGGRLSFHALREIAIVREELLDEREKFLTTTNERPADLRKSGQADIGGQALAERKDRLTKRREQDKGTG